MTTTQQELREQNWEALAVEGGAKLHGDDDVLFEGHRFVFPEYTDLDEGISALLEKREQASIITNYVRTFPYMPYDGARATALAIKEVAGFSLVSRRPQPAVVNVATGPGPDDVEQVPWGPLDLPGLAGLKVFVGSTMDPELGPIYECRVQAPARFKHHVEGLFRKIARILRTNSIYRGKAISAGKGDGELKFIDTSTEGDPIVYTDSVTDRLDGDLWSFLRYPAQMEAFGVGGKYAVLLEGPFGSGKTRVGNTTADIAVENGFTFIAVGPDDDLGAGLRLARMYEPAVVFAEDVDVRAGKSKRNINKALDEMDGLHTKGQKLIVVFTTNYADQIHAGMLRPGRIGATIHIGALDRPSIERLTRAVIGDLRADDVDYDAIAEAMDGYMPAFIKEALRRSVRYSISRNKGVPGPIGQRELILAADGLRDQLALQQRASTEVVEESVGASLKALTAEVIAEVLERAEVVRTGYDDDEPWATLAVSANGDR
jgi:transitional endoplasmic reticulum ATPase